MRLRFVSARCASRSRPAPRGWAQLTFKEVRDAGYRSPRCHREDRLHFCLQCPTAHAFNAGVTRSNLEAAAGEEVEPTTGAYCKPLLTILAVAILTSAPPPNAAAQDGDAPSSTVRPCLLAVVRACRGACVPWCVRAVVRACRGACVPWCMHSCACLRNLLLQVNEPAGVRFGPFLTCVYSGHRVVTTRSTRLRSCMHRDKSATRITLR
jgi:hypothetical protein